MSAIFTTQTPGLALTDWERAKAIYIEAKGALDAYDDAAAGCSSDDADRFVDVRSAAEDLLMAIPSPNAAAFAFKYLVAHGEGRETDTWNALLEREALQIVAGEAQA